MPVPTFNGLPPFPTFDDVTTKVNTLVNELRRLLLSLDSINIRHLTAERIDTGTLDAGKVTIRADLTGGAYIQLDTTNGLVINNGSVDTFTADVDGNVTMTSATIQTAASGNYPRIILDPAGPYILIEESATNSLKVDPSFIGATTPTFVFDLNSVISSIGVFNNFGDISLQVQSEENIDMIVGSGKNVRFGDWDEVYSNGDSQTLGSALNAKLDASAGWSGTYSDGTNTITVVNGQITSVV